ncbi:SGNH/GDSL hydrolase family protein [Pseudoalteromonas sp. J010]|uniref:SGNH/GDSL hydrolase family protein n=1 Tax=Pseudoalteromonas sp. J010 TaxID=998465 RepID=UPI000F650ED2|nr:SGNH/GDSL hydrolase family protein [Pseudoalteromonas sp. J010]RRS08739.1 SGNH/GDSL hydrolase family protein [Pseudoalteromonas sp. J010]
MSQDDLEKAKRIIRFFHPEKRFSFMSGANDPAVLAAMFGVPQDTYLAIRNEFELNVNLAARELLNEPDYLKSIQQIPLVDNATIAVIGDSLTDDYQSWFEILQKSFQIARPEANITWVNTALSGDTTMQLFSTLTQIEAVKPDYLFCLIGTNDGRVHGDGKKSCTGFREVIDNLSEIATRAESCVQKEFIWITPVGVQEDWIKEDWLLNKFNASWSHQQILQTAELIRTRPEKHIDITEIFAGERRDAMFLEDGLHWSLQGQKSVARSVVAGFHRILMQR